MDTLLTKQIEDIVKEVIKNIEKDGQLKIMLKPL